MATEPTLAPLMWAFIWIVVFAVLIYRHGAPKPVSRSVNCEWCNDRGCRLVSGEEIPCPYCEGDTEEEIDEELDHFQVSELLDEDFYIE